MASTPLTIDPERSKHFRQAPNLYELQDMRIEVARTHMLIAQQKDTLLQEWVKAYSLAGEAMNKVTNF